MFGSWKVLRKQKNVFLMFWCHWIMWEKKNTKKRWGKMLKDFSPFSLDKGGESLEKIHSFNNLIFFLSTFP